MTTPLIPRPQALAKLFALGPMPHAQAVACCGWGWEGFKRAAREATEAGLITFAHRGGTRVYRAGTATRRRRPQSWE